MAHITKASHVWDRAKSLLHIRQSTIDWFKEPEEYLEAIDECQELLALTVPTELLGALREATAITVNLASTNYPDTKSFDLPDECSDALRVADISMKWGSDYLPCDMKRPDDKRAIVAGNMYYGPPDDTTVSIERPPWAIVEGNTIYLCPGSSGSSASIILGIVKRPTAMVTENSSIEVKAELRELLPYWVASKLAAALEDDVGAKKWMDRFGASYQQITGSEWNIPREGFAEVDTEVKQ